MPMIEWGVQVLWKPNKHLSKSLAAPFKSYSFQGYQMRKPMKVEITKYNKAFTSKLPALIPLLAPGTKT